MEPTEELPDPEEIYHAADAELPKLNLRLYHAAMRALREKDYSFGDIAKWMTQRLGVKVTRSQVAYVLTSPDAVLDADQEADELEEEADQLAEQDQLGGAITSLDGKQIAE